MTNALRPRPDGATARQRDSAHAFANKVCPPSRRPAVPPSIMGALALVAATALASCQSAESAVAPAGPQASRIATLWWITIAVLSVVYLLVLAALGWAAFRRRSAADDPGQRPGIDGRLARVVGVATAITAVILFVFLVLDVSTGRALESLAGRRNPVDITLIGHQWWWEVRYESKDASHQFTTANEIHIPVGRPVNITTGSSDVIHSLWVPELHGKRDLIPGYSTNIWLQADRPGVYRGQCAEFCGLQHAHMGLLVIAEPEARYEQWLQNEADTARAPTSPLAAQGKQVFLQGPCALCHTIRGTDAAASNGPDLTHLASRRTLAAATLANTTGALAAWILDPHGSKPGNNMPGNALSPQDLQALLAYLGGLR